MWCGDLRQCGLARGAGADESGGEARAAFARALAADPKLIVADEPTSALDALIAASVLRLLKEAADAGTAIVVVSHDEPLLRALCHRVLKMNDGRLKGEDEKR